MHLSGSLASRVGRVGKVAWRPMLAYVAALHEKSTHPPEAWFAHPWEEIGPGYCYGPAFGHWDLIHQILDVLPHETEHARHQLLNYLAMQQEDGLFVAGLKMRDTEGKLTDPRRGTRSVTHPPVWGVAAQEHMDCSGDTTTLPQFYKALVKQIHWFDTNRRADPAGYFYTDILNRRWESGVDEGVRFDQPDTGPRACVDATSHGYLMVCHAAQWAARLGEDSSKWERARDELGVFIRDELYDRKTGFFHDIWSVNDPQLRHSAHEGMWPVVVGAATEAQARTVIDDHLLNPEVFFTPHPIATVGRTDPLFELRMWRGPAWNSMTYWAARGCLRYGRRDAAARLLESALDQSARRFARTGTIWEFYHPLGGNPEEVARKPSTPFNTPCRDYLGHNPLCAMARIWEQCQAPT